MKHLCFLRRVHSLALALCILFCLSVSGSFAQVVPSTGYTASQLVDKLAGPGVTILSPSLTCPGGASGEFTSVGNLGIDCGVVLTSGQVIGTPGINITNGLTAAGSGNFASSSNGAAGDAQLTALGGNPTRDACILEFDFIPIGSSISFDYVFGSEEYTSFTCTAYNDVFGFFISGGAYGTPTNIAKVPSTTIPVAVNSVNCGPTGSGSLPTCTAMGPGSPFCTYYVNNSAGTTVTYDGFTTVLAATAAVDPCITYHLKLGVADATDDSYDSGVFLKAGSLSSVVPVGILALGDLTPPALLRTCVAGKFRFTTTPHCAPTVVHYTIGGSAVNGYDYAAIPAVVTIPALASFADVVITSLPLAPTFPKTVTVSLLTPDHCDPTILIPVVPIVTATLTIYDTLHLTNIVPEKDTICKGDNITLTMETDPIFGPFMLYSWLPPTGLSDPTVLSPVATPNVTTTYEITGKINVPGAESCRVTTKDIKVNVLEKPTLITDSALVKTCVGIPVDLHVTTLPLAYDFTYQWLPPTALSNSAIANPTVNPAVPGDVTYTITAAYSVLPTCKNTDTIKVHTLPNDFLLNNDTIICIGAWVQGNANGDTEFTWRWRPHDFVADTTIRHTVIIPTVTTTYTVTASYAHCPDIVHDFTIGVDFPPAALTFTDTICLGMSRSYDVSTGLPGYYHYQWSPPDFISNDTMPNITITPGITGSLHYGVGISQHTAACLITDSVNLYVLPNTIDLVTKDTAICRDMPGVQVLASGDPLFAYQWLPTTGIAVSDVVAPFISADTSATYVVSFSFHTCPTYYDSVKIDVQPVPVVFAGGNRFVCEGDTLHLHAGVNPAWYTHYAYSWTPGGNIDHSTDADAIYYGVTAANVILTVTTPRGCKGIDSAFVTVYPGNFATIRPNIDFCPHDSAVLAPSGGISYQWLPDMYLSDAIAVNPVIKPITSQVYSVVATSEFGCKDTLVFTATVHPAAVIYLEDSVVLHPGETYQIEPQSNCTSFLWSPPAGLSSRYISNPLASPSTSTRYIVKATTEYGCVTKDSIDIRVDEETLIVVPNAFAPGSGANKEFKIIKRGIASLNYFRIFNRWGNLVFETKDINQGWDGTYNGVPQPMGVFVYEIQAVTSTGKIFEKHGNTTLLR